MNELGVQDSVKKRVEPMKVKSFIGFAVDSAKGATTGGSRGSQEGVEVHSALAEAVANT